MNKIDTLSKMNIIKFATDGRQKYNRISSNYFRYQIATSERNCLSSVAGEQVSVFAGSNLIYTLSDSQKGELIMKTDKWQKRVYRRRIPNFMSKDTWHNLRLACFKRDKYACQRCEQYNAQGRGLEAHHMMPRAEGGADDLTNLVTLCTTCHDYVEINGLKTLADIIGSYDAAPVEFAKPKPTQEREYSFTRPAWHRWVYGAGRK
jgi:hypothetical protein